MSDAAVYRRKNDPDAIVGDIIRRFNRAIIDAAPTGQLRDHRIDIAAVIEEAFSAGAEWRSRTKL